MTGDQICPYTVNLYPIVVAVLLGSSRTPNKQLVVSKLYIVENIIR